MHQFLCDSCGDVIEDAATRPELGTREFHAQKKTKDPNKPSSKEKRFKIYIKLEPDFKPATQITGFSEGDEGEVVVHAPDHPFKKDDLVDIQGLAQTNGIALPVVKASGDDFTIEAFWSSSYGTGKARPHGEPPDKKDYDDICQDCALEAAKDIMADIA